MGESTLYFFTPGPAKMFGVLLLPAFALAASHPRHQHVAPNLTLSALGTVNIKGVGDKYVVTGSPGNVDMVGNGFGLHGGGGVYLSDKDVEIGSDPFMYWQTNLADQVWSYDVDMANCLYPAFIGAGDACERLGLCKKSSGLLGEWTCDDCTAVMTRVAEFMKEPDTIAQGVEVLT